MDLTPYVEELQQQLLVAAQGGGDDAERLAERLLPALQSASHLVLLDALSTAAAEITNDLAPGSVEVRLRGREPELVVTPPPFDAAEAPSPPEPTPVGAPAPSEASASADVDEGGTARITLRLPEPLKARIEQAAGRERLSVNSWLVRTLSAAVEPQATPPQAGPTRSSGNHLTGWARS
jgi:hypothetical protein